MFDAERARELAAIRHRCPWCKRQLRPCNMARHIDRAHFHQLTVDEVVALVQQVRKVSR